MMPWLVPKATNGKDSAGEDRCEGGRSEGFDAAKARYPVDVVCLRWSRRRFPLGTNQRLRTEMTRSGQAVYSGIVQEGMGRGYH